MSGRDQARLILAAIEPLQRQLAAADGSWSEIDSVAGVLAVREQELLEVEGVLKRTQNAAAEATQQLDQLAATCAAEESRITKKLDSLKSELLQLEKQVAERRAEHDSILAGMASLHKRLSIGAA